MTKRAIISVSNKDNLAFFAKELVALGYEIISTSNTAKFLTENGVKVTNLSSFTGFPEILGGRVKTLHPKIFGGILSRRGNRSDEEESNKNGIQNIDLVIVNLYPFKETLARNASHEEIVENIDIGGPSLLRAASKNYTNVLPVIDPCDYNGVLSLLKEFPGPMPEERCRYYAAKVFRYVSAYDQMISDYLSGNRQEEKEIKLRKVKDLRYGENPHQSASLYLENEQIADLITAECFHGKELSFNNYLDLEAAVKCNLEFDEPAVVIVKHQNPTGVAASDKKSLEEIYKDALASDPVSAFGGIVAVNRKIDEKMAKVFNETFYECIIAPDYSESAVDILTAKKNLRILKMPFRKRPPAKEMRPLRGGYLMQDYDDIILDESKCTYLDSKQPPSNIMGGLKFGFKVVKHVKSNAIVICGEDRTFGICGGQVNRVDAVKISLARAGERTKGAYLASDAFFPFRDSIDLAAEHGISAIIQPGGSIKDKEVFAASKEHGIFMVLTGIRHFWH